MRIEKKPPMRFGKRAPMEFENHQSLRFPTRFVRYMRQVLLDQEGKDKRIFW